MSPATFQSGTVHGRHPSYSGVNVDSGSSLRTGIIQICAVAGMLAVPCGMWWRKNILGETAADSFTWRQGRPGLFFLLPAAAFSTWASIPGSTLSTRPPSWLVGWVVRGSKTNAGASAKVGVLVSTEMTVFSSRKMTCNLPVIGAGFLAPTFEDEAA